MLAQAKFYGGAHELTIAADTVISAGNARAWAVTASGAGLKLKLELPASWTYRTGYPVFMIWNAGGVNSFSLCSNDGTSLKTVGIGEFVKVGLVNTTGQGTWSVRLI